MIPEYDAAVIPSEFNCQQDVLFCCRFINNTFREFSYCFLFLEQVFIYFLPPLRNITLLNIKLRILAYLQRLKRRRFSNFIEVFIFPVIRKLSTG